MFHKMKRLCTLALALILCVGAFATQASAEGNTWYGDQVAVDVAAGEDGYNYMALFRKYVHGYEFGGHFMGDGEGPQTFVVIDTAAHDGETWSPDGTYVSGESNYEVVYCCDVETVIVDGTYYKRMNLEDSTYYNDAQAAKIRAIVTNAYPYVSLEEMKADLAANGFAYAEELTRNEVIAAVQTAIWACANTDGVPMRYAKSYNVSDNLQWGYPMYDTSSDSGLDVSGKRVFKSYEEVGARIDGLVDYLLAQEATYAEKNEIVITDLKMVGAPVLMNEEEQTYKVELSLVLNNSGSGEDDDITVTVSSGMEEIQIPVTYGTRKYTVEVTAQRGDEITAVVSGTQYLPQGVYFYAPAGGRDESQNLVGVAMGQTPVYCEDTVSFQDMTFKPGTASNISYMFINEKTGKVQFVDKIDLESDDCFVPIITKDGYVSAMFIKQSTSGMFWFSEEVDEETVDATIECLKENNPSYKKHNAVCYGEGEHELEFKSGKVVTYTFG